MIFGLILIVIGALLLLQNLGILAGNIWDIVWPVIIIAVGMAFFFKRKNGCSLCCGWHDDKKESQ